MRTELTPRQMERFTDVQRSLGRGPEVIREGEYRGYTYQVVRNFFDLSGATLKVWARRGDDASTLREGEVESLDDARDWLRRLP